MNGDVQIKTIQYKWSAAAEMGDCLTTIDIGQKLGGGCAPLGEGELGLHLTLALIYSMHRVLVVWIIVAHFHL